MCRAAVVVDTRKSAALTILIPQFPNIPDLCTAVNPESAVALGLAVRGAVVSGAAKKWEVRNSMMIDLLPHDIGVSIGDEFATVIAKNTQLPCRGSLKFTTSTLTQKGVVVNVGEDVADYDGGDLGGIPFLKEFRFMLHKLTIEEEQIHEGTERIIEISIVINDEGQLTAHCFDHMDPEHTRPNDNTIPKDQKQLIALCAILFLVYLGTRIWFANLDVEYNLNDNEEKEIIYHI